MSEWQPIETAPKGKRTHKYSLGPAILLVECLRDGRQDIVMAHWEWDEEDWLISGQNDPFNYAYNPTHWMPLPAPPQEQE